MADASAGWDNAEVVKGRLTPFKEGIALHIALIFPINIHLKGAGGAKLINHDRMINHQIHRVQRVDLFRIPAKRNNSITHRGQINHCRHAGKILHQNAGRAIGNFSRIFSALCAPFGKGFDIIDRYSLSVFEPQHIFQHHFQGGGEAREIAQTSGLSGGNRIICDAFAAHI